MNFSILEYLSPTTRVERNRARACPARRNIRRRAQRSGQPIGCGAVSGSTIRTSRVSKGTRPAHAIASPNAERQIADRRMKMEMLVRADMVRLARLKNFERADFAATCATVG
jgi:hypothetical protein